MKDAVKSIGFKLEEKIRLTYDYRRSTRKSTSLRALVDSVQSYCFFIGYPRSGHSIIGSLLDAHPEICISNELDAFKYFENGFDKYQIAYLILKNSEEVAQKGRQQTGYKYDVKGQYQGRFTTLRIIGDKKGGLTTRRIGRQPELLRKVQKSLGNATKFVHVIRNPFDNITTMAMRTSSTLFNETFHYFQLCNNNDLIRECVGREHVLDVRHDEFVQKPHHILKKIFTFLEVHFSDDLIESCAAIVYKTANRSRERVDWDNSHIDLVNRNIKRYPFLSGYSFDSP